MPLFLLPIINWLKPYLLWIALAFAAVLTVLAVLARAKHAGVIQERTEAKIQAGKNVERQAEARAKAPRSKSEVSDALRKGRF